MEATTPTAKSKRRLRRKRRELDALVVGVAANGRPSRRGTRTSSSSDSSSCGGDDPEAGLCPPRASSSSSGGGCRRRDEARRRCGRRHSRCTGGRGTKGSGRRCLSSRPRGTLPLAVRGVGACMAVACLLGAATTLAWLFLDARHQTDSLRVHLDAVVAGSKGVPDALQRCHSMSKELQHNQTLLLAQLMTLSSQVANFSVQVKEVHHGLSEVEDRLKGAPELVRVPQELAQLSGSVGQLGSTVGGLDASVTSLKSSNTLLRNETDTLHQEVINLKEALLQLSNASANAGSANMEGGGAADVKSEDELEKLLTALRQDVFELKANVSRMNDTLQQKILMDEKENAQQGEVSVMLTNMTARVGTLESSLFKDFNELSDTINHISAQVNDTLHQIESRIAVLNEHMNNNSTRKPSIDRIILSTSTVKPTTEVHSLNNSSAAVSSEKSSPFSTDKTSITIKPQISVNSTVTTGGPASKETTGKTGGD